MITAILAFFVDTVIGDPRSKCHPVVLIGSLIAGLEKFLYSPEHSSRRQLLAGGFLVVLVLTMSYEITLLYEGLLRLCHNVYVFYLGEALLLSFTISPKSLAAAGKEIYDFLLAEDLQQARYKVGWIVGRDTEELSSGEVVRATVETVAENTTDGIISPLFYFFIGGLPLAVLYRAVNTMDSMVGYKNERYLYFGRIAARLDDIMNYIPARITSGLFLLSTLILRYDFVNAWRMLWRDASKHPSPNGGWAEATVAGALQIRLGGYNSYFGKKHFRAYMGEPIQDLAPIHIMECIRLMYTASILFLLVVHCLYLLYGWLC